ncbi:MAG: hypothetical protein NZQ09_11965, partial [Chloroflexus sp.]|nr:hypothetical protein [Chloroflexus sp.]
MGQFAPHVRGIDRISELVSGGFTLARRLWIIGLALLGAITVSGLLAWQRARHYERLFHLARL